MKYFFLFCFNVAIISSCKEDKQLEQTDKILALKNIGNLATSEYLISKIVKASDDKTWFKFGNRKILMSCKASIKAGVDLSALTKEDINISGNDVTLYLTPTKILSLNIPPETVKLEEENIGLFRSSFTNEEQNQLLIQAEQQIRQTADSLGILKSSAENANLFFNSFLKNLGFKKITIEFNKPENKIKLG